MHSSLICVLIACLISFFVTSLAMMLGRPKDKQSALISVATQLILLIDSCISTFFVLLSAGSAIILFTKINFLLAILHFIGCIPVSYLSITFGALLSSFKIHLMKLSWKSWSSVMWLSSIEIHDSQLYSKVGIICASYSLKAVFAPPRQDIPGVSTNWRISSVLLISFLILALIVAVILSLHHFLWMRNSFGNKFIALTDNCHSDNWCIGKYHHYCCHLIIISSCRETLYTGLSVCLSVSLSVCLFVCLYVCPFVCPKC